MQKVQPATTKSKGTYGKVLYAVDSQKRQALGSVSGRACSSYCFWTALDHDKSISFNTAIWLETQPKSLINFANNGNKKLYSV